jgi:succinate dehydrogenase / fumarate reductase cytochrome b subunit
MSISGAFLVLFLLFHLCMNMVLVFSAEAYNTICELLGANWYALVGTLVLAGGVGVHVLYATWLTLQNRLARGQQRYAVTASEQGVSWASKNMYVLGLVVVVGLLLHLFNFWLNMQWAELRGEHVNQFNLSTADGAGLVALLFANPIYCAVYIIWLGAIWFHLTHGLWSMFQTTGLANKKWYPRLKCAANIVATLMMAGFAAIVVIMYVSSVI